MTNHKMKVLPCSWSAKKISRNICVS